MSKPADAKHASQEFGRYIDALIAVRRKEPGDDLISQLIVSEVEGHRLTDKELHSLCTVIFGAGLETTADAICVMLYYLAEHPGELRRLAVEPQLIAIAVEEFLRYITPIQLFGRNATGQVELHGRIINGAMLSHWALVQPTTILQCSLQPERCLLDRTPNRHLAFGAGIHLCWTRRWLGWRCRLRSRSSPRRILEYKVTPGSAVAWKTRGDRCGLATLPVVCTLLDTRPTQISIV